MRKRERKRGAKKRGDRPLETGTVAEKKRTDRQTDRQRQGERWEMGSVLLKRNRVNVHRRALSGYN